MSRENLHESKVTMADARSEMPCRTDMTAEEASYYRKMSLPGERKNSMLETKSVDRPRRGHGY
jgi:hypothetical protein